MRKRRFMCENFTLEVLLAALLLLLGLSADARIIGGGVGSIGSHRKGAVAAVMPVWGTTIPVWSTTIATWE